MKITEILVIVGLLFLGLGGVAQFTKFKKAGNVLIYLAMVCMGVSMLIKEEEYTWGPCTLNTGGDPGMIGGHPSLECTVRAQDIWDEYSHLMSPDEKRPAYSAYFNVLAAPAALLPLAGAAIGDVLSLKAVFTTALLAAILQLYFYYRLSHWEQR